MATTLSTDMKYQDPFFYSGYTDVIQQAVDKFNGGSNGTITLTSNRKAGDYDYASFFENATGLVSRQDITSVSDATAVKLTQGEVVGVKLNRKILGEWARSSFLKAGLDENALRVAAGEAAAKQALQDMLNSSLRAGRAALDNVSGSTSTVAADGTMTTTALNTGLSLMGDQADRVSAFVMHSKVYFDLVGYQITPTNNGDIVANSAVVAGMPATLGRPIIVTDSDALIVESGTGTSAVTDYYTLGLTGGGLMVEDTEEEMVVMDMVTGKEQLIVRMQGEYGYNLNVKGFAWDVANGGKNPADAAVGTGSNWDAAYSDVKSRAGVVIQSR